jgi:uncharacterized membrane protein
MYVILKKTIKSEVLSLLIAGASGAITNTGLVILALYLAYKDTIVSMVKDFGIGTTFAAFAIFLVTTSMLVEASIAGIGTMSVVKVHQKIKR